jgi:hypothetical protein
MLSDVALSGHDMNPIVVMDINATFLHCRPFDEIDDWSFAAGLPVWLVIPVRVIEELDEKKLDQQRQGRPSPQAHPMLRERLVPSSGRRA